jgi:hypothetical protein
VIELLWWKGAERKRWMQGIVDGYVCFGIWYLAAQHAQNYTMEDNGLWMWDKERYAEISEKTKRSVAHWIEDNG